MSANAASISFGGVDLYDYKLIVVSPLHPYLPAPRVGYQPFTGANGGASFGSTWEKIDFNFECVIVASTYAQFKTYIDGLVSHLRSVAQEGEQALVLGWDSGVSYNARLTTGIDCAVAINGGTFELGFMAPDGTAH